MSATTTPAYTPTPISKRRSLVEDNVTDRTLVKKPKHPSIAPGSSTADTSSMANASAPIDTLLSHECLDLAPYSKSTLAFTPSHPSDTITMEQTRVFEHKPDTVDKFLARIALIVQTTMTQDQSQTKMAARTAFLQCEDLGLDERIYHLVIEGLNEAIKVLLAELDQSVHDNADLLDLWLIQWHTYCRRLARVNFIFDVVNYPYVIKQTRYTSLNDLGRRLYADALCKKEHLTQAVIRDTIVILTNYRRRTVKDKSQLVKTLQLLHRDFWPMMPQFNRALVDASRHYFDLNAKRGLDAMTMSRYLTFCFKLIVLEQSLQHELQPFLAETQPVVLRIASESLILNHLDTILKDFVLLIQNQTLLGHLYCLALQFDQVAKIQDAFANHVKDNLRKLVIVDDLRTILHSSSQCLQFVTNIHRFRLEMQLVIETAFMNDSAFTGSLKDGLETIINEHSSLVADCIAHFFYYSLLLKANTTTPDDTIHAMLSLALELFRSVQAKDVCRAQLQVLLAKTLLWDDSPDLTMITFLVENLRDECGKEFVLDLLAMVEDVSASKKLSLQLIEKKATQILHPVLVQNKHWPLRAFWGQKSQIKRPSQLREEKDDFCEAYKHDFPKRRLYWIPSLGTTLTTAYYLHGQINLHTTEIQAVLLLFLAKHSQSRYTPSALGKRNGIYQKDIYEHLKPLCMPSLPLVTHDAYLDKDKSHPMDTYRLNLDFIPTQPFASLVDDSLIPGCLKVSDTHETEKHVLFSRQQKLEAVVMNILKAKRTCTFNELQELVLARKGRPWATFKNLIKPALNTLADRGLVVKKNDTHSYQYQE
ncbi:hypothetical protein DM01DRAFT_1337119 [Hesseltinella vesiculosa]|uniref:Cullin family profile domain-containing protein n=1 Tax=Hesseltinella vesiculosa TaxID=101127 RepID=A0A1X2GDX5_9FUNG|nr:hypothetical protein DM01DRAFT_1337119 [Hesseltinella vesiculosa]